jgi:hypothetical protein
MMVESGKTVMIGGSRRTRDRDQDEQPLLGDILLTATCSSTSRRRRLAQPPRLPDALDVHSADTDFLLKQEMERRHQKLKDEMEKLYKTATEADAWRRRRRTEPLLRRPHPARARIAVRAGRPSGACASGVPPARAVPGPVPRKVGL